VQTDKAHEFFITAYPAPPNGRYQRQLLYSGEDGDSAIGWAESRSLSPLANDGLPCVSPSNNAIADMYNFVRVIHRASYHIASEWLSADWLDQQQLGILFLTSGVGETSPPVAVVFDSSSRFCFATVFFCVADLLNGNQVFKTIPRFDLPNPQTLATSFLTNGVGATSPPVWLTLPVVAFFTIAIPLFRFSSLFISRLLFSSILKTQWSRFKSRSPPFAFFIDLLSWSSRFINQPYKNNTEKEDAHTANSTL
jgi:hypothetical protein